MSKYLKLYSPGTVLTGSAFKIYLMQRDVEEIDIPSGFEIGKIKIQGTGSAFDTQLSVGGSVIIGSIGGTQEVTIGTKTVNVPNRRIKYTVDSITSATEFITKSFHTSKNDVDSTTTDAVYDKKGKVISFDIRFPHEAGMIIDDEETVYYGNTYTSAYTVTGSSYINIDDIINYREDPNDSSKMIVILKNTIDPIWFHNQIEELDFILNPDSGAGYDLFKPNLELLDTSSSEGKVDRRRTTNRATSY